MQYSLVFTNNSSTVSIASLDMSNAFDKVYHYALFLKLMERHVPVCLINLLANWYENVFISVRWGQSLSKLVRLTTGVRQGGILSPVGLLFAVYVNDIITRVESSGYGCEIAGKCVGMCMRTISSRFLPRVMG